MSSITGGSTLPTSPTFTDISAGGIHSTGTMDLTTTAAALVSTSAFLMTISSIGTGSTLNAGFTGLQLINDTPAADNAQQYSPIFTLGGQGRKSAATAGTRAVEFTLQTQPVQGSSAPTGNLVLSFGLNGVLSTLMTFESGGPLINNGTTKTLGRSTAQWGILYCGGFAREGTSDLITVSNCTLNFSDGVPMAFGTSNGTQIGTSTSMKIAFHGSAAVAQRTSASQAAVVTTPAALASYGYTQAQADAIVTLLNELRAALVEKGLIKGS